MKKVTDNYFSQRNHDCQVKINKILNDDLPDFCREFFVGIQNRTSFLTRLNYSYDLRTFFRFSLECLPAFKNYKTPKDLIADDLNKYTSYDLELFLNYLSDYVNDDGVDFTNSERGKARKLSAVKSLFKYFFRRGLLNSDVSAKVDSPRIHEKEIIRLERNEVNDLLDTVEQGSGLSPQQRAFYNKNAVRDMAIVALFLGTGIRVSELVGLNVEDVDFKNDSFVVTRKGGNRVILYLNEEIKEYLTVYIKYRETLPLPKDEKALFISIQKTRLTTRAVENIIKKYSKIAVPLKKITPHKLRSTFGTELYRTTGDIYVVADVLGHKDVNTTKKHYAALTEDVRKRASQVVTLRKNDDDDDTEIE